MSELSKKYGPKFKDDVFPRVPLEDGSFGHRKLEVRLSKTDMTFAVRLPEHIAGALVPVIEAQEDPKEGSWYRFQFAKTELFHHLEIVAKEEMYVLGASWPEIVARVNECFELYIPLRAKNTAKKMIAVSFMAVSSVPETDKKIAKSPFGDRWVAQRPDNFVPVLHLSSRVLWEVRFGDGSKLYFSNEDLTQTVRKKSVESSFCKLLPWTLELENFFSSAEEALEDVITRVARIMCDLDSTVAMINEGQAERFKLEKS